MELTKLWKKESNCADAQYITIFYGASHLFNIAKRMPTKKNNFISKEKIRVTESKKNVSLELGEMSAGALWDDILENCSASVRFAETGSEQVAVAYENRSKYFYMAGMFRKCLVDIDMAKSEEKCPKALLPILEQRKRQCAERLRLKGDLELARPTLSFAPDSNIPGFADVLQIQHNDEFGYHVVAKCDIDVGKTVVVEECFSSYSSIDQNGCCTCQRIYSNFIPCDKCTSVVFCNTECKERNLFHVHQCGIEWNTTPDMNKNVAQSILIAMSTFSTVENLIEFVEMWKADEAEMPVSIHSQKDKYRMFLKLHTGFPANVIPEKICATARLSYSYLMQLPTVKEFFPDESHQRFLMHLVLKHAIVQMNGFCCDPARLTTMIYTASSLFNHSCFPNLLNHNYDDLVCIAKRPIRKGEQLFVKYLNSDLPTPIRQKILRVSFGFDCKCDKCNPSYEPAAREIMQSNKDYKYMKRNQHKNHTNNKTRAVLKQSCENFLNEF